MPDGPFKSMQRDPDSLRDTEMAYRDGSGVMEINVTPCEKCGADVYPGDWPFCRPGHPEDHER